MIARFTTLLPFAFSIRVDERLQPYEMQRDPYRVKIYAPLQARVAYEELGMCSKLNFGEVVRRIEPAQPQNPTDMVLINDGPTIQANLLQIDFLKDDFDRRPTGTPGEVLTTGEPPAVLAFDIANELIGRLRTLTRGCELSPLNPDASFWRLDYLSDDEKILPKSPNLEKARRRGGRPLRWRTTAITQATWQRMQQLTVEATPQNWDTLLLDAEKLLPDVNAAIALANAGLEAFSTWLIDELAAKASLPTGLWRWMTKRGFFLKDPSVEDRFDPLLKIFAGRSLKDNQELWNAYVDLRKARNSFSHRGKPVIDATEVTVGLATELITRAQQIVDWCELLLPEGTRRPKVEPIHQLLFSDQCRGDAECDRRGFGGQLGYLIVRPRTERGC